MIVGWALYVRVIILTQSVRATEWFIGLPSVTIASLLLAQQYQLINRSFLVEHQYTLVTMVIIGILFGYIRQFFTLPKDTKC